MNNKQSLRETNSAGRGREGGGKEGSSRNCMKDPWTKPKGGRIDSGRWGWVGWGEWGWENGNNYT